MPILRASAPTSSPTCRSPSSSPSSTASTTGLARSTSQTATPYSLLVAAGGAEHVLAVFSDAIAITANEFELPARPLDVLNRQLAEVISRGGLVVSIAPAHTALERQFREAVAQ